ncbi:MAG: DUF485 domain-containing protein [Pseudonocardiaceae bacterium]
MSGTERGPGTAVPPPVDPWVDASRGAEFAGLRRRLRGFIFPVTGFFLGWYFLYVLLAAFAPGFMSRQVAGNINIGLIFGLLQFATTFAITIGYGRFATRKLDPVSERIRERLEGRQGEKAP